MKLLESVHSLSRKLLLARQARLIEKAIIELPVSKRREAAALTLAELEAAASDAEPEMYASTQRHPTMGWGNASQLAYERARSKLLPIRVRGLALWIAVVYHETRNSNDNGFQALHREVLGLIAELKASLPSQQVAA